MASEAIVQREIWLRLAQLACRLFRLNTGRAWLSSMGPAGVVKLVDGSVLIKAPRSIALGFSDVKGDPVKGACDLPGWTTVEITPAMIGRRVAVFTSIECKKSKGGRWSDDQKNWADQVDRAGGIAGFASSPEEATKLISDWACR